MLDVEVRWAVIQVPVIRIARLVSQSTVAIVRGDVHRFRVDVRSQQSEPTGKPPIPVDLQRLVVGRASGDVLGDCLEIGIWPA